MMIRYATSFSVAAHKLNENGFFSRREKWHRLPADELKIIGWKPMPLIGPLAVGRTQDG